ncbi:MAG: phosphate acyltransferase PlsX [Anaerolineales bacterium]
MRIALDAMGSDNCPLPEIQGAEEAARLFGDEIILIGSERLINERLSDPLSDSIQVRVLHAPDAITMEDKGLQLALKAKRKKAQTSMAIGMDMLKSGEADVFITAGNTGGALATAFFRLGIIAGVERPALTALFPVMGGYCTVLDIGANPDCDPEHIVQFAIMGSVYANKVLGVSAPKVGLISNAEEKGKGNELIREVFPLLENSDLNFVGNIEGKELFGGLVDVAVTDGFTGNVVLKISEAVAKMFTEILRTELTRNFRTKLGALLAKPAFNKVKIILDPSEIGAAPLLGVNGLVFIGHGRSDKRAIVSAIRSARLAVKANLLDEINDAICKRVETLQLGECN